MQRRPGCRRAVNARMPARVEIHAGRAQSRLIAAILFKGGSVAF